MKNFNVKDIPPDCFFSSPLMLDEGFIIAVPEMKITQEILTALQNWNFTVVSGDGEPQSDYQGAPREEREYFQNDAKQIKKAEQFYVDFQLWTGALLENVMIKQQIRFNDVAAKMKDVIDEIYKNRRFLLQVQRDVHEVNDESFLLSHAVKSTIVSLVIGMAMKMPIYRLIELGVAALLHEIGMIKLPPKVYLGTGDLSDEEHKLIYMHPKLGYEILKANDFPMTVCAPALEHHERENGSGYPYKLQGNGIGTYSKIIAVACSYEAITTKRPHKAAEDGYQGMLKLLRNEGKQYDETVLSCLVRSLSLFPIGQFVVLSNGKWAQVVDANPNDPRYPIVQVFDERTPDGKNKIITTDAKGIYISKVLDKKDIPTH
ncbi:MAG: HD-GYP domain-containing protein [Spirochaetaceae bacterium]|jgi:HD-GYP domain-containing protein (c-di-GMP phosphodiesterase class II)|nr:HD-GYP domain-containing protein [Spirochaetaceae bacterium]